MVTQDELRRLLDRTRDHNITAPRLTEAEFAARPNPYEVALKEILADDDHPDRPNLVRYIERVDNDRAANLLHGLVIQRRVDLSQPAMAGIVAAVWTLTEPFKVGLNHADWIGMFRTNGYTHERRPAPLLTDPVTVYRGTVDDCRVGMSWTTDYDTAREFACDGMSSRARGNIYRATIRPRLLLAYIHDELGRGEFEFVVDQDGLSPSAIELVARGDHACC